MNLTLQHRLVKALRLVGVSSVHADDDFLEPAGGVLRERGEMVTLQPTADAPGASGELDEITFARAQKGERVAWAALVAHHQGAVFALISRILGRRRGSAAHQDLAQETFLRVFRALPTFERRGPARLSTWILTIASRLAISELRRRPVEYLLPVDVADPRPPRDPGEPHGRPAIGVAPGGQDHDQPSSRELTMRVPTPIPSRLEPSSGGERADV